MNTSPLFQPDKMRALVRNDNFLSMAHEQMKPRLGEEDSLAVLFNTYVEDDSVMLDRYQAINN